MDSLITYGIFFLLVLLIAVPYWRKVLRHKRQAERAHAKSATAGFTEPIILHPKIDLMTCIGCASCVRACPESVLGIVEGHAAIVNGARCISHALCVDVCPVGAITMGFGAPKEGMEIPFYDDHQMTNVEGIYIVGELGGIGLIRNAIEQGAKAVSNIRERVGSAANGSLDLVIVGAGPAGIGAALAAKANNLRYTLLEQYDLGGSILHYPRKKLVLTKPLELPLYGRLKLTEISKEELLALFTELVQKHALNLQTQLKVESITRQEKSFRVQAGECMLETKNVVLALGRRGSPRRLHVPGEELPKVYYRLIEAETYNNNHLLVVGGGDSAVEAAIALASQKGNTVTLSYRRAAFVRLKEKNEERINTLIRQEKVRVMFESEVASIHPAEAVLREGERTQTIPNDFVFVFAGGELPAEFLKKTGIQFRSAQ